MEQRKDVRMDAVQALVAMVDHLRKKLSEARVMNKEIGKHLADSGCFG